MDQVDQAGMLKQSGRVLPALSDAIDSVLSSVDHFSNDSEKLRQALGFDYLNEANASSKSIAPFGVALTGSHAFLNGNFSASRPTNGPFKMNIKMDGTHNSKGDSSQPQGQAGWNPYQPPPPPAWNPYMFPMQPQPGGWYPQPTHHPPHNVSIFPPPSGPNIVSVDHTEANVVLGADEDSNRVHGDADKSAGKRPVGRDRAKAANKKSKSVSGDTSSSEYASRMQDLSIQKINIMQEESVRKGERFQQLATIDEKRYQEMRSHNQSVLDIEQEKVRIMREKHDREEKKEDERILSINLDSCTPSLRMYYEALQEDIMAKLAARRQGRHAP
ncbi:Transcription factor GAMYB [Zea mays]|uniref:Transcription factor GAMYB n=1 Tax=Zea mays TaxID=4577 RepID=A0A3L6DF40_MAIZE|nr:Transcription factor GAMYB [Zea mays]